MVRVREVEKVDVLEIFHDQIGELWTRLNVRQEDGAILVVTKSEVFPNLSLRNMLEQPEETLRGKISPKDVAHTGRKLGAGHEFWEIEIAGLVEGLNVLSNDVC
eukprot:TRINITY_DN14589_c0_g1_i1.p2 TRINITY_DN14589_c0_g1~~TRINITY_DN14589_c0_g1_i1.p2  ORF type:complete len:104 (-),score=7.21 TRINITY_DN14589_c0_g1_i1:258-569(-)